MSNEQTPDDDRRTVLKTLAATGLAGAGIAGASGSASANPGRAGNPGQGNGNVSRLSLALDERGGEFADEDDEDAENIPNGFTAGEDATFDGELILEDVEVAEIDGEDHLLASGRLRGTLSSNPTEQVNETFDGLDLGGLLDALGLVPDEAGECPVLDLEIEPIFLDLLGLQLETETIDLDLTAVAGEGNLVGNLLCAVAGLLDP